MVNKLLQYVIKMINPALEEKVSVLLGVQSKAQVLGVDQHVDGRVGREGSA